MFQGVTALLIRSLREDAIRIRSHLGRIGFMVITSLLLTTTYSALNFRSAVGRDYFISLIVLDIIFLLTVGLGTYSAAIAEEREQATLGLLKLTGVSRLAILLGKSTSWLITTLSFMLLQLPFIALAVTMGGVSFQQVLAAATALGAFAILLCNFALLCSLVCHTTRSAAFCAGFWIGVYFIVPNIAVSILRSLIQLDPAALTARLLNPILILFIGMSDSNILYQLGTIQNSSFADSLISFQVVSNLIAGLLFFGLSWLLFETCTRNLEPPAPRGSVLNLSLGFRRRAKETRISIPVWKRPFLWQQFYFATGGYSRWILRWILPPGFAASIMIMIAVIALMTRAPYNQTGSGLGLTEAITTILMIILWTAICCFSLESLVGSTRIFGEDFRNGTLSSLLILPISSRRIALARVAGEGFALLPYLVWILITFCTLAIFHLPAVRPWQQDRLLTLLGFIYSIVVSYLLTWHVAAWYSVHVKRGAVGYTILTLWIGWIVMLALCGGFYYLTEPLWDSLPIDLRGYLMVGLMGSISLFWIVVFHLLLFRRVRQLAQTSGV